jgi:hypothetical protein
MVNPEGRRQNRLSRAGPRKAALFLIARLVHIAMITSQTTAAMNFDDE